ncbi:MAG: glycosyltransferase [Gemmatimonadota bacterium]|nr:glycosyltransferase [Gemmatimonadota bacterium]
MRSWWPAILAALPWLVIPVVVLFRGRGSRTLDEESTTLPDDAPLVAVIIPARNEARSIERCVRSILGSAYPRLEVIVVDDDSADGTGDIARRLAAADPRLRVVEPAPLPAGWFGKQWACAAGAATTRAELLCFTDADTEHAPDLLPRAVNALRARGADMLTVAGTQEMATFWERVIQPQIFALLAARYGGTERVNAARRPIDKIANGQFMLHRRAAYEAVGGHASVHDKVAEDLALAQRLFVLGRPTAMVLGLAQLRTRMYASLGELVGGWMKNIYAGALDSAPGGRLGRRLLPLGLLLPFAMMLAPPLTLAMAALGITTPAVTLWAAICTATLLAWGALVYRGLLGLSPLYALTFPLGAAVLAYIATRAIVRGRRVRWKEREYVAG